MQCSLIWKNIRDWIYLHGLCYSIERTKKVEEWRIEMNVLLLFVWNCIVTQSQVCFIDIDFLKKTTSLFSKIFHIFEWLVLHTITKLAFYLKLLFYNRNSPYLDILCRTCNKISNYSRFLICLMKNIYRWE